MGKIDTRGDQGDLPLVDAAGEPGVGGESDIAAERVVFEESADAVGGVEGEPEERPLFELSLVFPNGSSVVGLPAREATIRGFSAVSMVIIDEAARVPDSAYQAVRPMLAVGSGDMWLMSTPKGKRGFFYEQFAHGNDKWARIEVPATACPERISSEFLEEELADLGPSWMKQEYFCQFVDNGSTMFDQQLVEDAVTEDVEPLGIPYGGLKR